MAGLCIGLLNEPPDSSEPPFKPQTHSDFSEVVTALSVDRNLRNLVYIAMLFGLSYALFPHYQSLGKSRLGLGLADLVPWMIAQNIGVTIFSLPIGWVADRLGNRMALKVLLIGTLSAPLLAIWLSANGRASTWQFAGVFLLLGMMPITMRIVNNYALELTEPAKQPLYLSITNLALSLPVVVFSLLVGWLIDLAGFEVCFMTMSVFLLTGFIFTARVAEPRQDPLAVSPLDPSQSLQ